MTTDVKSINVNLTAMTTTVKSPNVDLTVVTIAVKSEEKDTFTNKKIVAVIVPIKC